MAMVHINNTKHITIANMYIPPRDSTSTHYKPADTDIRHCIQYITSIPQSVLTGDVYKNHPYTETGQGHLPRNFLPAHLVNLPSRKSPGISVLPTINNYFIPAQDQHGFRREHSTTSALLQLTTDVAVGFNQRNTPPPPDRTVCIAVDLSPAFDTVCHTNLLSKINRSQLPPATARWFSCYLRSRQAKTCFRELKSTSRNVTTGDPQGSKLSPSLFSFYIADVPMPTNPVKRVCYADDLTVWTSGVNIPDLEVSINNYLEEITAYLKDNYLLISAQSLQSRCSPRTHTKPKSILVYSSIIDTCHWLNAQVYWGSIWTPPYYSTSTSSLTKTEELQMEKEITTDKSVIKILGVYESL